VDVSVLLHLVIYSPLTGYVPYRGHQFQQQLTLISSPKQPQSRDSALGPAYDSFLKWSISRLCKHIYPLHKTMQLACLLGKTLQRTRISTHLAHFFKIDSWRTHRPLPTLHNCCNLSTNPTSTLHCTKKVDTQLKALWWLAFENWGWPTSQCVNKAFVACMASSNKRMQACHPDSSTRMDSCCW